mgnify:CR=1 FL=1|jgi:hypothetical protein
MDDCPALRYHAPGVKKPALRGLKFGIAGADQAD